jgi:ATP-dependent DNA ligase
MTEVVARYAHPQGSTIEVFANGALVKTRPDGKKTTTSATPEKLAAGHGGWLLIEGSEQPFPTQAEVAARPAPKRILRPMKFDGVEPALLNDYIENDDYVLQQKIDGIRAQLVYEPRSLPWFRNGAGARLVSSTAAKTTEPLLKRLGPTVNDFGFTIDGEVLDGCFYVFDLIIDGGEKAPLHDRLTALEAWHTVVNDPSICLLPTARTTLDKQRLAVAVYEQGAEGWIAKRLDGTYDWGQRVAHSLKIKLTKAADCVVLERNRDGKSNMVLAVWHEGVLTEIGSASAIGKPDAKVGEVVEVRFLYLGADRRLVQPTVLRLRTDKAASECNSDQMRFTDKQVVSL